MTIAPAKRRVLCIVRWPVGGIRTWCRYVYSHPEFRDFDLTIAAPGEEFIRLLTDDLGEHGVRFETLPDATRAFVARVRGLVKASSWSLLHSHGFTAGAATALGRLGLRVPHLITQHDVILRDQYRGLKGACQRQAVSIALRSADLVHSVSDAAASNLCESFPWLNRQKGKLRIITNGIESARFLHATPLDLRSSLGLARDDFLIGFFGRFMGQKGFRYLVEALQVLRTKYPDMPNPVVVAPEGGGFVERERREIEASGLATSFRFLPFAPNLGPLLKAVDVVVMPSLWEACGLLAMETLAAGVPLICSDCESLVAIAHGTPAAIVPKADSQRLAAALHAEATRPGKQAALAYAATAASRFDVAHAAAQMADLYRYAARQPASV